MLKELSKAELQNVVGGNAKFATVEGVYSTLYRDEEGVVRCGTPPWPKPRPKPKPNRPRL